MPRAGMTTMPVGAWRDRAGFRGVDPLDQPAGTLDLAQRARLRAVATRLKLTHDLLACFADRYAAFPAELAEAQTRELVAVRALLDRYGVADPDHGLGEGLFAGPADRLGFERARDAGGAGRSVALDVIAGMLRETATMLEDALPGLAAPDVRSVYRHLLVSTGRQARVVRAWSCR